MDADSSGIYSIYRNTRPYGLQLFASQLGGSARDGLPVSNLTLLNTATRASGRNAFNLAKDFQNAKGRAGP